MHALADENEATHGNLNRNRGLYGKAFQNGFTPRFWLSVRVDMVGDIWGAAGAR